jgi:tetratricopeptide (TPR) repeat protein
MAEGEFARVRKYLELALGRTSVWFGEHDIYAMLVDAAAQERDSAALQQYAPLAEQSAARYDHKLYRAVAHRAWGVAHLLAGQFADAERRLKQALVLFESLDTRWQIGRTLSELGELALAQRGTEAARDYFSRALAAFEALGAVPDANRTRERLAT